MDIIETFEKVTEFLGAQNITQARVCLNEIEDKIPDNGAIQKIIGQLYQWIGDDEKSLKYILRARELLPDDTSLLLCLGYHYLDNGAPQIAADFFEKHLLTEAATARTLCFLGRAHDYNDDKDKAENILRKAVKIMPSDIESQLHLGRVLMSNKKYKDASDCFEELKFFYPKNIMVDLCLNRVNALLAGIDKTAGRATSSEAATVVCVKHGTKYGADYVNRLASMVRRWSSVDVDFFCLTDDPSGLGSGIQNLQLPSKNILGQDINGWWQKLFMFGEKIEELGSHILYFDLDVVITGSIDPLLFYDSDFAIAQNCYVPIFSSSVMRFKNGSRPEIWSDFSDINAEKYGGDEIWIASKVPDADVFPDDWCKIYRLHAAQAIPEGSIVISFGGEPNPADYPTTWVKDYWH
jgi:tetratricopeptide (TPR) repeat protein